MAGLSSILIAGATALSAGASIYSGIQQQKEGEKQAELAMQEAEIAATEERRVTERQKTIEQRDIKKLEDRQKLAFLASGVTLKGSPLLKLEETRRLGAENIEEIERSGQAASEARLSEGRVQARRAKSAGRQGLISGITGAVRSGASGARAFV